MSNLLTKSTGAKLSVAFSGCGWLTPFHLGVLEGFRQHELLNHFEYFAGTSGGSLAALIACTTGDFYGNMKTTQALSRDKAFFRNIDAGLRGQIADQLGSDAVAEACSDRLQVVVSRVWPRAQRRCLVVSKFHIVADVVDAVSASCFIPLYSARRLTTRLGDNRPLGSSKMEHIESMNSSSGNNSDSDSGSSGSSGSSTGGSFLLDAHEQHFVHDSRANRGDIVLDGFVEGGILPPIGRVAVSPFPKRVFAWEGRSRVPDITLELLEQQQQQRRMGGAGRVGQHYVSLSAPGIVAKTQAEVRSYPLGKLLRWALLPPDPIAIQQLFDDGQRACEIWLSMPHVSLLPDSNCKNHKSNNNNINSVILGDATAGTATATAMDSVTVDNNRTTNLQHLQHLYHQH